MSMHIPDYLLTFCTEKFQFTQHLICSVICVPYICFLIKLRCEINDVESSDFLLVR